MRRPAALLGLIALLLVAAPAARGAGWRPPMYIGGLGTSPPTIAVDDRGDVFATWPASGTQLAVVKWPAGGTPETPQLISTTSPFEPQIGVDGAGNAVLVWTSQDNISSLMQARRAVGDGSFTVGPPVDTDAGGTIANGPRLAVNRAGEAIVGWDRGTNPNFRADWALGSTTSDFGSPVVAGPDSTDAYKTSDVAMNAAGDAVFLFTGGVNDIDAAYRVHGAALPNTNQLIASENLVWPKPQVSLDDQGRAVAIWAAMGPATHASFRAAGAGPTWSASPTVVDNQVGTAPDVAFDESGQAVATYAANSEMLTSTRPAGDPPADFPGPPTTKIGSGEDPFNSGMAGSVPGNIFAIWRGQLPFPLRASLRPPGGSFGPIATLTENNHSASSYAIAVAKDGNAAAVWADTDNNTATDTMAIAVYDATGPAFGAGTTVPGSAFAGDLVGMSATATDDFSNPSSFTWDFGDGATGGGGSVSHSYAAPGTYNVDVKATDLAGNVSNLTRSIVVFSPAPTPTRGVDFNASSVSGKVLVSVPKNAPAGRVLARAPVAQAAAAIAPPPGYRRFRLLGANDNIPVGSILDATKGVTQLKMATNATSTATQLGKFSQGVFKTQQSKGSALTTVVLLGGGNFRKACRPFGFLAKKRKKPRRHLFGNAHGHFRSRGRQSVATIPGTEWLTKDECKGTTTKVFRGRVVVRDLVKHRTVIVRAGHSYLAASPRVKKKR